VEELLAERGVEVGHVAVYRWVRRFTLLLADAAGPAGAPPATVGRSTRPTKVAGQERYVYRAIDQFD
jgi:transposase-like protein